MSRPASPPAELPRIAWIDAYVDVPAGSAAAYRSFWALATAGTVSSARGDRGQFRSILPAVSRAYLRVQEWDGPPRVHLDLVSADLAADRKRLMALGAVSRLSLPGVEILDSPAGQVHCLVADDEPRPVPDSWAVRWPGGHHSRLRQVCLDVPPSRYDEEVAYWAAATAWELRASDRAEFTHLLSPPGAPVKLLLQRLSRDMDELGAHLDIGTDDIPAEVARLLAIGSVDVGPGAGWHVLADPVLGLPFCVTPQRP